jgi:hypothetical protein
VENEPNATRTKTCIVHRYNVGTGICVKCGKKTRLNLETLKKLAESLKKGKEDA